MDENHLSAAKCLSSSQITQKKASRMQHPIAPFIPLACQKRILGIEEPR